MNYASALAYLRSIDLTMVRYERSHFDAFVKDKGLSLKVPFIHIAGSNGKGSTASFLYRFYLAAGYKAALFSKPFLYEEKEMISYLGQDIGDEVFASYVEKMKGDFQKYSLSAFEALVAVAYTYFNDVKPDIAIIETGMGGRLDATNIEGAIPVLSIVTSVSLEHTRFLGDSISSIASHKAGIIKNDVPLLMGEVPLEARKVLEIEARKKNSPAKVVSNVQNIHYESPYLSFDYGPYRNLLIPSMATYLAIDAAMAIEALLILRLSFPVSERALREGLMKGVLPCRMESHPPFIFDGAHNPEAAKALAASLSAALPKKPVLVFASFKDKNVAEELKILAPAFEEIHLTTFAHKRAMGRSDFAYKGVHYPFDDDVSSLVSRLLTKWSDRRIVFAGSIAFASYARKLFGGERI